MFPRKGGGGGGGSTKKTPFYKGRRSTRGNPSTSVHLSTRKAPFYKWTLFYKRGSVLQRNLSTREAAFYKGQRSTKEAAFYRGSRSTKGQLLARVVSLGVPFLKGGGGVLQGGTHSTRAPFYKRCTVLQGSSVLQGRLRFYKEDRSSRGSILQEKLTFCKEAPLYKGHHFVFRVCHLYSSTY